MLLPRRRTEQCSGAPRAAQGIWREAGAAAPFLRNHFAPQRAVLLENQSEKPRESEGRTLSAPKAPCFLFLADNALTLAHGVIPIDHDGVGVVDDAVADGVGEG